MTEVAQQAAKVPGTRPSVQVASTLSPPPSLVGDFPQLLEKTPVPFHGLLVCKILEQGGFFPDPEYEGAQDVFLVTREDYLLRSFELRCESTVRVELEMFLQSGGLEYEKQSFASFCRICADKQFKEYEGLISPEEYQKLVESQAKMFNETLSHSFTPLLAQCREELKTIPNTDPDQALSRLFAVRAAEIFAAQSADKYQLEPGALSRRWAAVLKESEGGDKGGDKDPKRLVLSILAKKLWEETLTGKQQEAILKEVVGLEIEMLESGLSVLRAAQLAIGNTRGQRPMMATLTKTLFNSSEGYATLEREQGRFAAVSTLIEEARARLSELKELNQRDPAESFSRLSMLCRKESKDNVFFALDEAFEEYGNFEFSPVDLQTAAITNGILLPLEGALSEHPKTTLGVTVATAAAVYAVPEVACPLLCLVAGGSFVYNGSKSLILAQDALRDSRLDLLYESAGHAGSATLDAAVLAGAAGASRNALLRMRDVMKANGLSPSQYCRLRLDNGLHVAKAPVRWLEAKLEPLKPVKNSFITPGEPGVKSSPGGGYGVRYTTTPAVDLEPSTINAHIGSSVVAETIVLPGREIFSSGAPTNLLSGTKGVTSIRALGLKAAPYMESLPWGQHHIQTGHVPALSKQRHIGHDGTAGIRFLRGVRGPNEGGGGLRRSHATAEVAENTVLPFQTGQPQAATSQTTIKNILDGGMKLGADVDFNATVVTRGAPFKPSTLEISVQTPLELTPALSPVICPITVVPFETLPIKKSAPADSHTWNNFFFEIDNSSKAVIPGFESSQEANKIVKTIAGGKIEPNSQAVHPHQGIVLPLTVSPNERKSAQVRRISPLYWTDPQSPIVPEGLNSEEERIWYAVYEKFHITLTKEQVQSIEQWILEAQEEGNWEEAIKAISRVVGAQTNTVRFSAGDEVSDAALQHSVEQLLSELSKPSVLMPGFLHQVINLVYLALYGNTEEAQSAIEALCGMGEKGIAALAYIAVFHRNENTKTLALGELSRQLGREVNLDEAQRILLTHLPAAVANNEPAQNPETAVADPITQRDPTPSSAAQPPAITANLTERLTTHIGVYYENAGDSVIFRFYFGPEDEFPLEKVMPTHIHPCIRAAIIKLPPGFEHWLRNYSVAKLDPGSLLPLGRRYVGYIKYYIDSGLATSAWLYPTEGLEPWGDGGKSPKGMGSFLEYYALGVLAEQFNVSRVQTSDILSPERKRQIEAMLLPYAEPHPIEPWRNALKSRLMCFYPETSEAQLLPAATK